VAVEGTEATRANRVGTSALYAGAKKKFVMPSYDVSDGRDPLTPKHGATRLSRQITRSQPELIDNLKRRNTRTSHPSRRLPGVPPNIHARVSKRNRLCPPPSSGAPTPSPFPFLPPSRPAHKSRFRRMLRWRISPAQQVANAQHARVPAASLKPKCSAKVNGRTKRMGERGEQEEGLFADEEACHGAAGLGIWCRAGGVSSRRKRRSPARFLP